MKTNVIVVVLALMTYWVGLCNASAHYDPGTQRWINRDPVNEIGFKMATGTDVRVQQANDFLFVRNTPLNGIDLFGLYPDVIPPNYNPDADPFFKLGQCAGIAQRRLSEFRRFGRQGRLHNDADKWYHCVTACEITKTCGETVAKWMGNYWEWRHKGPDELLDQKANADGRNCGDCNEKRSCEQCCADAGYER